MSRKLIAAILAVLIGVPALYFGATMIFMSSSSDAMGDIADESTMNTCEQVKSNMCAMGGVSESDYPDSCFQNGEHVLDDPYQCSN